MIMVKINSNAISNFFSEAGSKIYNTTCRTIVEHSMVDYINKGVLVGLSGGAEQTTLYAKSTLDFISSIVVGATLGVGTALSAICVFLYQGAIELAAGALRPILTEYTIAQMSAAGSLIIFALGLNMIGVTKIKVANLLPAIFIPMLLCLFM